jgi:16S rRNA (cytidine1402-2'-O)-methyltransferase
MGILYLVATPIGNLEDITLRALRILKEVSLIAAEDTRTSRVLLNHYQITTQLTSYYEHNKLNNQDVIYRALEIGDVALISDAGTPNFSDPGYELVRGAIERGYQVVPIPGANAAVAALCASGLPSDQFLYLGFVPKKDQARRDLFDRLRNERATIICYESPHRLGETLGVIAAIMGANRQVVVGREITKMFEEFYRAPAYVAAERYSNENPKGEITLLIAGQTESSVWDEEQVRASLQKRIAQGESRSAAAKAIAAESGWRKGDVYGMDIE